MTTLIIIIVSYCCVCVVYVLEEKCLVRMLKTPAPGKTAAPQRVGIKKG